MKVEAADPRSVAAKAIFNGFHRSSLDDKHHVLLLIPLSGDNRFVSLICEPGRALDEIAALLHDGRGEEAR